MNQPILLSQHTHLDFKEGKVEANTHPQTRAKGNERAYPAPILAQPPANTTALSGDAFWSLSGLA